MKILKLSLSIVSTICVVVGLFIPFFTIGNVATNFVELLKNLGFNWVSVVFFSSFLFLFISSVLLFINIFKNKLHPYIFVFSILSGLIFCFSLEIYSNFFELTNVSILPTPIILAVVAFSISLIALRDTFNNLKLTIKDIVEIGIFVSFALVLQLPFLKIKMVAGGGSISFTMIPLILLVMRKGFYKGFISVGIVFGLIDCMMDGYGFVTYPLDYLLAYGSLSLVGLFNKFTMVEKPKIKNFIILSLAIFLSMVGRTAFSTISGIILYNTNFIESLLLNLSYIGPSAGIAIAGVLLLYKPMVIVNNRFE